MATHADAESWRRLTKQSLASLIYTKRAVERCRHDASAHVDAQGID